MRCGSNVRGDEVQDTSARVTFDGGMMVHSLHQEGRGRLWVDMVGACDTTLLLFLFS